MGSNSEDTAEILFNFGDNTFNIVNLDEEDGDESDETLEGEEFEEQFVRSTPDVIFIGSQSNSLAESDRMRLDHFSSSGRTYRPGKTVELVDGDFLRITAIVPKYNFQTASLKGIKFRRTKRLEGLMEFKRNETTMLLNPQENDTRDIYHQSIQTVELADVVRIRELIKTNRPFPALSFRETDPRQSKDFTLPFGRLVCRTKLAIVGKAEGWLQALDEEETDDGYGIDPRQLRSDFRGETERGGMCATWLNGEKEFDEAEKERCHHIDILRFHRRDGSLEGESTDQNLMDLTTDGLCKKRRYTLGDAFCGAGGVSRGAKAAGFRIDWGFDFDPAAINSFKKNFHRTRCEAVAAHDFVTVIKEDFRVDVLHLSPPCQTFSIYHVHNGKNDELNQATFFAIEELIKKVKPRIVTLEEAFGLSNMMKHQAWFRAMIQIFTKLGFSLRWKVFKFCDYGLPQPRRRLILFASCPGEPLPEFPAPTHCKAADIRRFPHLLPFMTVDDAISQIPREFPLHNLEQVSKCSKVAYPANIPLRHTICCGGNLYYHPSGERNFTLRELACLQGFPLEHQFDPRRARMQIGNAVPPVVAKVFFDHIRKHLLKVDGLA